MVMVCEYQFNVSLNDKCVCVFMWYVKIDKVAEDVQIPRGKYPIFFFGTHETLVCNILLTSSSIANCMCVVF